MPDLDRRASSSLRFEDMTWPNPDDPAAVEGYLRYGTPTREHLLWAASVIGAYRQLIEVDQRTRATRVRQIRRARDEDWARVEKAAEDERAAALDAVWRERRRTMLREHLVAEAERQAARVSRSLVCATGARHGSCHGGTVCLCECHDQKIVSTTLSAERTAS